MKGKLRFDKDLESLENPKITEAASPKKPKRQSKINHGELNHLAENQNPDGHGSDSDDCETGNTQDGNASSVDSGENPRPIDTSNESEFSEQSPTETESVGKLKFSKEETQIEKLEQKVETCEKKLKNARDKLPTKTVKKRELTENKGKAVSKLTHEKEAVPIGEAKWNKPKKPSTARKITGIASSVAVTKIHSKIHSVEHENVAVSVAHQTELIGESAFRGSKRGLHSAYRFHKNRPYRQIARLEKKSINAKMKLDYKKALRDNPKLKSSPVSRYFQKRAIKRSYAQDLRNAQKTAQTTKKSVELTAKVGKSITAVIRKNPIFLIKIGFLLFIVFIILSLFSMCAAIFSGGGGAIGSVTYAADYENIDAASIAYTEWETDLQIYIDKIQTHYSGYDEYHLNIGNIEHDPFEIMAFLTAVYQDFSFEDISESLREVFDVQYVLETQSKIEIRTRTETRKETGEGTDSEGNSYSYTYTYEEEVEYEWHILNVTLTATPFREVVSDIMTEAETHHFNALMYSRGTRQLIGNPFDTNWIPYVSSIYGYRIHPIYGDKQFHWGIDIGFPTGTPLFSGFDGVVVAVGYESGGYGNYVVIETEDGIQARYAHCDEVFVTAGQEVVLGEVFATVGNTGASTGAHLHMEIAIDGVRINPIFFVDFRG
ncbi:MAG: M23 family metallopeptidase [Defluviitaleaceae bacterium]|nr:M23 family metallopeptidase [Defluviitaleaceae bacterium]